MNSPLLSPHFHLRINIKIIPMGLWEDIHISHMKANQHDRFYPLSMQCHPFSRLPLLFHYLSAMMITKKQPIHDPTGLSLSPPSN